MCSERALVSAMRERPVDRPEICRCSTPEPIHVALSGIQILSFDDFATIGPGESGIASLNVPSHDDVVMA